MKRQTALGLILVVISALLNPACAFTVISRPPSCESRGGLQQTTYLCQSATPDTTSEASTNVSEIARENDVILYDGVCNFCNTWVDILLRIDVQKKFRFAPLQSRVGQELLVSIGKQADDISSVVLIKANSGESYDKSRCVLKVVEELGPLAAVASQAALVAVPDRIRDSIYDTVAENRYNLMGKRDECRCSDPEFADRFLLD